MISSREVLDQAMHSELKCEAPTQQRLVGGHRSIDPGFDYIVLLVQEQRWPGQVSAVERCRLPAVVLGPVLTDAHGF